MIEFTKGDMFALPVDARVNTVNCQGVMGAGVALAFKKRYPQMFEDYRRACEEGLVRPGKLHVWRNITGDWIINFPTKRNWREPSRYEDIAEGLGALREYLHEQGPISVALPALGCGHGQLDWTKVSSMITEQLSDLDAKIYVFEPKDSLDAGRGAHEQPTEAELSALEASGFSLERSVSERVGAALLKGNKQLLKSNWIVLLPSREPDEREFTALTSIARQIASDTTDIPVAMLYSNQWTEQVSKIFRDVGIAVVLILPFGPLSRKTVANGAADNSLLLVSLAGPSEAWQPRLIAQSMDFLREHAVSVLLADPRPKWVNDKTIKNWEGKPIFYVKYGSQPEWLRDLFKYANMRPITRKSKSGEPNISGLLRVDGSEQQRIENEFRSTCRITIGFDEVSSSRLREIAEAFDRFAVTEGKMTLEMVNSPETSEFREILRRIFGRKLSNL